MARSRDTRHPLPAERGPKRTGPIGTILPGDDLEVARDIQRLWWAIDRLQRKANSCCDGGGGGGPVVLPPGGFPGYAGDIQSIILGLNGLEGWWRLGESPTWPADGSTGDVLNAFADSSSHGRNLKASVTSGYATGYTRPTNHVAGAVGDADDGALQFNKVYWPVSGPYNESLCARSQSGADRFVEQTTGFTLAFWFKFLTYGMLPTPVLGLGSATDFPILSTHHRTYGVGSMGWYLSAHPSNYKLAYCSCDNTGSGTASARWLSEPLAPGEWNHVAVVLTPNGGGNYTRDIYVNLHKLFTETGSSGAIKANGGLQGDDLTLGGGYVDDLRFVLNAGVLDEVVICSQPASEADLVAVYHATAPAGAGDQLVAYPIDAGLGDNPYGIHSSGASAGDALLADGDGGTYWDGPIVVYKDGV